MRWRSPGFLLVTVAVSMATAPSSRAQPEAPSVTERARELKKQGDAAMDQLRYEEALADYDAAYRLEQDPALLYNAARALQGLGRYPAALEKIEDFDRVAPPELKARAPALAALIAEIRSHVSKLTVSCKVPGARVLVRNTVVGTTPMDRPVALPSGKAVVEIEAEGYFPFRRAVDLPKGGVLLIEAQLVSRSTTGLLVVRTSVPGADVFVNGRALGVSPVETFVDAGDHTIAATHPDWRTTETSTTVAAGQRKEVNLALKPPGLTSRWWFWAGIGAVVISGVAVGIALNTERGAGTGDIAPGRVSGPLSPALVGF